MTNKEIHKKTTNTKHTQRQTNAYKENTEINKPITHTKTNTQTQKTQLHNVKTTTK